MRALTTYYQALQDEPVELEQRQPQPFLNRHSFNQDRYGSSSELLAHGRGSIHAYSFEDDISGLQDYCSATNQGLYWDDWTVDRRQLYSMTGSIKSPGLHMLGHSGGLGSLRYLFRFHFRFKKRKRYPLPSLDRDTRLLRT